jgi:hypothetical protein
MKLEFDGTRFRIDGRGPRLSPRTTFSQLPPGRYACQTPDGTKTYVSGTAGWWFAEDERLAPAPRAVAGDCA